MTVIWQLEKNSCRAAVCVTSQICFGPAALHKRKENKENQRNAGPKAEMLIDNPLQLAGQKSLKAS